MRRAVQALFVLVVAFHYPVGLSAQSPDQPMSLVQISQVLREDPDNDGARWALARASFRAKRYDVARYHITRLLRTTQSQANIDTLTKALADITNADKWNTELSFALLPSTNIRRYTYNNEFETLLGVFVPVGGGEEESGIGLAVGAGLSYGLGLPDNSILTLRARVDQNAYDSPDLNRTSILFAARRDVYAMGQSTSVEPFIRFRFDDVQSLERRDLGLTVSRIWWLEDAAHLSASLLMEHRTSPQSTSLDGPYGKVDLRYSQLLGPQTRLGLGFSVGHSKPEQSHLRYWEGRALADVSHVISEIGTVGVFGSFGARRYEDIFPATDLIREDDTTVLGASYQPQGLEVFGSRPRFSCQVERNRSNIALYDYETIDCRLTFERSF